MLISLYFRASYPKRFWGASEKNYCIRLGRRRLFFFFFANLSLFLVFSFLSVGEKIFGQAFFTSSVLLQGLVCNETWRGSKMEQAPSAESYGINTRSWVTFWPSPIMLTPEEKWQDYQASFDSISMDWRPVYLLKAYSRDDPVKRGAQVERYQRSTRLHEDNMQIPLTNHVSAADSLHRTSGIFQLCCCASGVACGGWW